MVPSARLLFWAFAFFLPAIGIGQTGQPASKELDLLLVRYDSIVRSGDLQARLHLLLTYKDFLHDAPNAVLATARGYAAIGDSANALSTLHQFAELGQTNEAMLSGKDQKFQSLSRSENYKLILKDLARNKLPLSAAEIYLSLSDTGFLPEDLAYDSGSKSFLLTSVLEKKIIRLNDKGKATLFATSPSKLPMFAVKVDAANKLVWATEVAVDGFAPAPKNDWGHSALLSYDLITGTLKKRIEGPPQAELGDLMLDEAGTPIVSDGKKGGIYKLVNDKLERIDKGDFISPQTMALTPDKQHLIVPDYVRGVALLDPGTGQVQWLKNGPGAALSGVDGVYSIGHSLILTQNGTTPGQVIRLEMDSSLTTIVSSKVIERATPTLGDPTHGVVVGDWFYYIANSGWDTLTDSGEHKPGIKSTSAHIMRCKLSKKSYNQNKP